MPTIEADDMQLDTILSSYNGDRSELIPILQDIQEKLGYIPREAMQGAAKFLNIPESTVYGVVTFYAQFYLTRQGKHMVKICQGTACHVRGGAGIMQTLENKLGIRSGETTSDYNVTLERVACLGSCALAPAMVLDGKMHGPVTAAKAEDLVDSIRKTADDPEPVQSIDASS